MPLNRNFWPLGIITAFAILFGGIATVIVIAATHRDTLVNENYYENELKFQTQIDSATRAKHAGATLTYDVVAGQIQLKIPATQMAEQIAGTINLYRPSSAQLDRQFMFKPGVDGVQFLNVSEFAAGPWLARVSWTAGGQDYFLELKFIVSK